MSYGLTQPLESLVLKVERAGKHVLDLETEYASFLSLKPYSFAIETDPNSGARIYRLTRVEDIPLEFSLLIGDAVHNLRSCLDHVAYALAKVSGKAFNERQIKFPLADSKAKFEEQLMEAANWMRRDALASLEALQSYCGGMREDFWRLNELSNRDKHRFLLPVLGIVAAHTALPSQREEIARFHRKSVSELNHVFVALPPSHLPLKPGDVVLSIPKSEITETGINFILQMTFSEPDIAKGTPVVETLDEVKNLIRAMIFDFDNQGLFQRP
jgi:hypothetical protein